MRTRMLERVILSSNICLLNTGSSTYMHAPTQSFSAIDLSLCSPSLFNAVQWSADSNPYGSDHFPIVLKYLSNVNAISTRPRRWKLSRADWGLFEEKANLVALSHDKGVEETNDSICKIILNAVTESIP